MSRPVQIRIVAFALVVMTSYLAHAGQPKVKFFVGNPNQQQPFVQPQPQSPRWFFGMSVVLDFDGNRQGLRVINIQPGSPAHRAGLEVGDFIRSSNGQSFQNAHNNRHAVAVLQQTVSFSGNGGGFPGNGGPVATFVNPGFASTDGVAHFHVRDVRSGQLVHVDVFPTLVGGNGGPIATFKR
jgi:hypothetical protein